MQAVADMSRARPLRLARRFVTTRWSVVIAAGAPDGAQALAALCRAYWGPVHAFVQGHGLTADDASDVTQGFFEQLLRRGDIADADRTRGRFRSWLRKCAHNYLRNWFAHKHSLKVGGQAPHVAVDSVGAELRSEQTPERAYERRWALTLMERALGRLRRRYEQLNNEHVFEHLQVELAGRPAAASDQELARLLGRTVGSLKVERHRLHRRFQRCLKAEVLDTVANPADVDDEIRRMIDALG